MSKKKLTFIIIIVIAFLTALGLFFITRNNNTNNEDEADPTIVTANFIAYDLARAITGDAATIKLLLPPGTDAHTFDPTPQDIIDIENAALFIYNGGESDAWVDNLLADLPPEKTLRLMDTVELKTEEATPEMTSAKEADEDEEEYDEHIWTSLQNTIALIAQIKDKLIALNPEKSETYTKNANNYIATIENLDKEFQQLIAAAPRKELVFADRFPFRYLADEYDLSYAAAFPGCAEQTEASAATIAALIDKVKEDNIPVILKIELTSDSLAQTISAATGAKLLELHAAHNISQEDFTSGVTYADLLRRNLAVLQEALYD